MSLQLLAEDSSTNSENKKMLYRIDLHHLIINLPFDQPLFHHNPIYLVLKPINKKIYNKGLTYLIHLQNLKKYTKV